MYLRGSSDKWQVCCGSAGVVADANFAVLGFNLALVSLDCGASLLAISVLSDFSFNPSRTPLPIRVSGAFRPITGVLSRLRGHVMYI